MSEAQSRFDETSRRVTAWIVTFLTNRRLPSAMYPIHDERASAAVVADEGREKPYADISQHILYLFLTRPRRHYLLASWYLCFLISRSLLALEA
jgi:hypothetical protein